MTEDFLAVVRVTCASCRTLPEPVPGAKEVAPFAGASRRLVRSQGSAARQSDGRCWRSTLPVQLDARRFALHGLHADDFSSEFDPYSPQFGEKFAGAECADLDEGLCRQQTSLRLYSDQWRHFQRH
ncbi:hypothetical protein ACFOPS_04700 [Ralstonia solanacearum]|uniref:hypothetical protein n=1 Tax=Ralstonia solanacearum TaxID=305 RepID=UPI003609860F